MQIEKYPIQNPKLSMIAEFIWHLTSDTDIVDGKLLPVLNTDLIINLSSPISYRFIDGQKERLGPVHIRYVKTQPQLICQVAIIDVWGVSLFPYGVYPLLQTNMSELEGCIIDLHQVNPLFTASVLNGLSDIQDPAVNGPLLIEDALLDWVEGHINLDDSLLLQDFTQEMLTVTIGAYCRQKGIGVKKLERLVKKYIGLTPKQLQQIGRFQQAGNQIIYASVSLSLADLAYSHNYYDQMYLTKNFKEFTGVTPSVFHHSHDSIKEKLDKIE